MTGLTGKEDQLGTSFSDALSAVSEAAERGIGAYEMVVAFELGYEISAKKKSFRRRKKLIEKLDADSQRLFDACMEVFFGAAGSLSAHEVAQKMLDWYLNCGMDVDKARLLANVSDFAM